MYDYLYKVTKYGFSSVLLRVALRIYYGMLVYEGVVITDGMARPFHLLSSKEVVSLYGGVMGC